MYTKEKCVAIVAQHSLYPLRGSGMGLRSMTGKFIRGVPGSGSLRWEFCKAELTKLGIDCDKRENLKEVNMLLKLTSYLVAGHKSVINWRIFSNRPQSFKQS